MSSSLSPCHPPSENLKFTGCFRLGPNPEKSNEIFNKIFTENYTESMVMEEFRSDPKLRVDVMKNIIASFHCQIHHDIIKERIGFAVWIIGEYSLSVSEIEDGLSVIKRSIGRLPFPNNSPPSNNDHYWFEECRQRLGDAKIRMQIAMAITKLIEKLEQVLFVDTTYVTKLRVERTEAVRLMASMWLLPKPVGLGPLSILFYTGEIRRCMRSICYREKELMRVLKNASAENLVSFLSKKLQEDRQTEQCDQAIFELVPQSSYLAISLILYDY